MPATRGIERLFVALPVPAVVADQLAVLRPAPAAGIRLAMPADLHVTLHFLGNGQAGPVLDALGTVRAACFDLRLSAPGSFALAGGRTILFCGVEPSPALTGLRRDVGDVLAPLGFRPERRPWVPHITLARLGHRVLPGIVDAFLGQRAPFGGTGFAADRFALYASRASEQGPRYRVIRAFALAD